MYYQSLGEDAIREGVQKYGPAVGAKKMMDNEYLAAEEANQSGLYITYICPSKNKECFRVGSKSKCFCGHVFGEHNKTITTKKINTSCLNCPCKVYKFIPSRPEECGMWWLPRRKDFDIRTWRPKCKFRCGHTHEEHNPNRPQKCAKCTCFDFKSDFACITCDMLWEDHEMCYEFEDERKMAGKPIGKDFYPLAQHQDIQEMVFSEKAKEMNAYTRPRPSKPVTNDTVVQIKKTSTVGKPIKQDPKELEEEKYNSKFENALVLKPTQQPKPTTTTTTTKSITSNSSTLSNKTTTSKTTTSTATKTTSTTTKPTIGKTTLAKGTGFK